MNVKKDWQDKFFKALAKSGNVAASCRLANITQQHVYQMRKENPDFAKQWEQAIDTAIDALEAAAFSRAKRSSDTLLIFLLKSHRPAVYRENTKIELSGNVDITNHYATASQVFDSLISETARRQSEADIPSEVEPRAKG